MMSDIHRSLIFISALWLFLTLGACSWMKSDPQAKRPTESSASSSSAERSDQTLKSPRSDERSSISEALGECDPAEGVQWEIHQTALELCRFPTNTFRCKRVFAGELSGAEVIEAVVDARHHRLIWRGVIASEEIPSAHSERIYTKTRVLPVAEEDKPTVPCRAFIASRIQRARSFNLVDAREEEFDEASEDEVRFEYSLSAQRYLEVAQEEEDNIRVRPR